MSKLSCKSYEIKAEVRYFACTSRTIKCQEACIDEREITLEEEQYFDDIPTRRPYKFNFHWERKKVVVCI